jgi:hypothetical protein
MIKIETEKVLKDGELAYKITGVSALPCQNLPEKYFGDMPYCYKSHKGYLVVMCDYKSQHIQIGDVLSKTGFETALIPILTVCGERLAKINAEIRTNWAGTQTFEI